MWICKRADEAKFIDAQYINIIYPSDHHLHICTFAYPHICTSATARAVLAHRLR
jgi:hypothetical protein